MPAAASLRPYVPEVLLHLLQHKRTRLRTHAAALFADISGFTAMTAAFAAHGQANAGAEELTEIINRFFVTLISVVDDYGGDILNFGGDALTVAFRGPPARQRALSQRAIACAHAMQQRAQGFAHVETRFGVFALHIKIGLSFGHLHIDIIEDTTSQARLLASGDALVWAGQAEHTAQAGQIIRHVSIDGTANVALRKPHPRRSTPAIADADLRRFIPTALAERVLSGHSTLLNEHRPVTVLFANLAPSSQPLLTASARQPALPFPQMLTLVQQFGGHVTRLDSADKGLRLLALFGAPTLHEDDAERATRCAWAIQAELGSAVRMGLASGLLFCGDVGAAQRREYTVMGDAVNVAARLMQQATWGQTLANAATQTDTAARIAWQPLEPVVLKGKAEPTAVYTPLHAHDESAAVIAHEPPLFGRGREQAVLSEVVAATAQRGQTVLITGEAGMGKSRLATHASAQARARGMRVLLASGQVYPAAGQTGHAVAQQLLRRVMGLAAEQTSRMADWLSAHAPHLQARLGVLLLAVGQPRASETWLAQLDNDTRNRLLHDSVWAVLRLSTQPTLIVVDDGHVLDEGSRALLQFISGQTGASHISLLVLSRSQPQATPAITATQTLPLGELTEIEARQLADYLWQRAHMPNTAHGRTTVQRITQRAQGNPLFIEQLVQFVQQQGTLADPVANVGDLPNDLRGLMLQRIDQLPPQAQTLIKVASVIGPEFQGDWVQACWPGTQPIDSATLQTQLAQLIQLDLISRIRAESAVDWASHRFRHATLREAAYSALSFATRAALHEQIGLHIEAHYAQPAAHFVPMLAHHFGHSKNTPKQRVYFRQAGDLASVSFANDVAMHYYSRLLPLLAEREQAEVSIQLSEVQAHTGQWAQAETQFRTTLGLSQQWERPDLLARAQLGLGRLLARSHSYAESAEWLQHARTGFLQLNDPAGLCNVLTHLSFAQLELGELAQAEQTAQQQWQLAQTIGNNPGMTDAQQTLGQLAIQRGQLPEAHTHLQHALQLAETVRDPVRNMLIENDIATLAWRSDDYPAAFAHFVSALRMADQIGLRAWVGVLLGNLGVLYWELGAVERAHTCQAAALNVALALGDQSSQLTCLGNLAALLHDTGDTAQAQQTIDRAIDLGQTLQMPYYLCDHACQAAEWAFAEQHFAAAARYCELAHAAAETAHDADILFRVELWQTRLAVAVGRATPAQAAAKFSALLESAGTLEKTAILHDHLYQLQPDPTRAQAAIAAYARLYADVPRQRYCAKAQAIAHAAHLPVPTLSPPAWVSPLCQTALPTLNTVDL